MMGAEANSRKKRGRNNNAENKAAKALQFTQLGELSQAQPTEKKVGRRHWRNSAMCASGSGRRQFEDSEKRCSCGVPLE